MVPTSWTNRLEEGESVNPPFLLRPDTDCVWLFPPNEDELFVYWRLSEVTRHLAELHTGIAWASLPRVLRLYESGDGTCSKPSFTALWDTEVEPSGSLYVKGVRDGAVYIADIGYRNENGTFVALCRSEPATAPGAGSPGERQDAGSPGRRRLAPFQDKQFSGYTLYAAETDNGGLSP